jgi:hypothetical protein
MMPALPRPHSSGEQAHLVVVAIAREMAACIRAMAREVPMVR